MKTTNEHPGFRRRALLVVAAVGAAALASAAHADRCYADTKMDVNTNYVNAAHAFGLGGTLTVAQQASGGNPGTFLRVDIAVNNAPQQGQRSGVVSTHLLNGALYDASIDGEIVRICYEEWAYLISGAGDGQATGPVLRQTDGGGTARYYRAMPSLTVGTVSSWERRAFTLTERDFVAIDVNDPVDGADQSLNPDFSAFGSPIEFGFFRTNNTSPGGAGFTRSGAIDSWSITVISEPCPADLNKDGIVDFADLLLLINGWNCTP